MNHIQTPINIVILREKELHAEHLRSLQSFMDGHPGPIKTQVIGKPIHMEKSGSIPDTLAWDDLFKVMAEFKQAENLAEETFVCLLTATPNEENWFAVNDPENPRHFFIHADNFSWITSSPSHYVTAHFVIKCLSNGLLSIAGIEFESLRHFEAQGCFNDFCERKKDLCLKLRTADICGDCLAIYQEAGFPTALFEQMAAIFESIRRTAVNTSQFLPEVPAFLAWPYPVAITRHKVVQATRPLFRFLLLLDHFDSMVRYFFLAREISEGRQPVLVDKPSLGWWVDQLARCLKGTNQFREVVIIANDDKVVNLRNERRGHGYMATNENAYAEEAANLEKSLTRIEDELRPFFERYQLVIVREIQLVDEGFQISGDILAGSHSLHPPFQITIPDNPRDRGLSDQHRVYLTDREYERFHSMYPYIRHETCPECKHPRLLITDGGTQYIDAFMGHRVNIKH